MYNFVINPSYFKMYNESYIIMKIERDDIMIITNIL